MQLIRKILKQNLQKINATRDTVVSITENGELFVNSQTGDQIKISDVEIIDNEEALSQVQPVTNKLYVLKDPTDVRVYDGSKYISFKATMDQMYDDLNTKITNTIESINTFKEEVVQTNENNTTKFNSIDETITSLSETVSLLSENHRSDIESLNTLIEDLTTNYSSFTNSLTEFNNRLSLDELEITKLNNKFTEFQESLNTVKSDVSGLSNSVSEINASISDLQTAVNNNTTDIDSIKEQLSVKRSNIVIGLLDLEQDKVDQEIYIPAFIEGDGIGLYIKNIIIRSNNILPNDISFTLKYAGENEDGSLRDEEEITTITLSSGNYKSELENTIETKYTNGFFRLYVNELLCDVSDAFIILEFEMK